MAAGATVLFLADDRRFIALNVTRGCSADDDPATADGYVTVLDAAARGLLERRVLLLGLGPRRTCGGEATRQSWGDGARRRAR